jgi:hypothetical protein
MASPEAPGMVWTVSGVLSARDRQNVNFNGSSVVERPDVADA